MENNSTWTPSVPSPTVCPPPERSFPIGLSILAALGAVLVALIPAFLYGAYLIGAHLIPPHSAHETLSRIPVRDLIISQVISYVPLIAYLLYVVPRLAHRSLADLGVRKPTAHELRIGLLGIPTMWIVVALSSSALTLITHEHTTEAAVELLRQLRDPLDTALFVLIAVLLAPMIEEFTFRVFLFNAIKCHTTTGIGVLFSGLLFGLVHGSGITVILPLALGGMVLAMVYQRSGCYWSNVVTHAMFNGISVIAVLVFHITD